MFYSQFPRTRWFAQDISVPGVTNKTLDLYYNGLETKLITNTVYNSTEVSMTILDDELAVGYAWWRGATISYGQNGMKGRPILDAVEPNEDGVYQGASYLLVKLVNDPASSSQHIWRLHNFKPTKVDDIQLSFENSKLVTFGVTGTFTHITFVQDPLDEVSLGEAGRAPVMIDSGGGSEQPPQQ